MAELISPNALVARTLWLLSRAAIKGVCRGRLKELIEHLECVADDRTLDASIRTTSEKLAKEWKQIQAKEFGAEQASSYH